MPDSNNYQVQDADLITTDIHAYLKQHENKDLLRFLTCGSVDDGKSTLIGRLLYDAKMIYEDQLSALHKDSESFGTTNTDFDPALLLDGLKAEREQGITIDVAYRYFSTSKRKFIIADTPGHEQYTRNMATGASTCNLAVVLIDARHGVIAQTKRHSFICSLLGIKHVVVAVNKMDLVDWSQDVYDRIRSDYNEATARLDFADVHFIPVSALLGDNVVDKKDHMPWYTGPVLLNHLENVTIASDRNLVDMRFPVQYVIRPNLDFRGFAGALASGVLRKGDEVMVLPSRQTSRVKDIVTYDGSQTEAFPPQAITVTLDDEVDISRGDMLVHKNNLPKVSNEFEAMLVWMDETATRAGQVFYVKQTTTTSPGTLSDIRYKIDVNTMRKQDQDGPLDLGLNEIARVKMIVHRPLMFDAHEKNRATGSFILINRITNATVAAGMILDRSAAKGAANDVSPVSQNIHKETGLVSRGDREQLLGQKGSTVWLTGLSGSGKSTIAQEVEKQLIARGHLAFILDGDNIRHGLNRDLGFSAEDRTENIRRVAEVAKLLSDTGVIVITAFISPLRTDRGNARNIIGSERFAEVFVDTPIEVCEARDPKGLYQKARAGDIPQFTGISAPYEPPVNPEISLATSDRSPTECAAELVDFLIKKRS